MCERATLPRAFQNPESGERVPDIGRARDENDLARDGTLDQEAIAALIRFFRLLDQWEREAAGHAEIM